VRQQLGEPLRVGHVGLAAGHVLHVPGVDEADLEAAGLENLEHWNPVDASRLHHDGLDPAGGEPLGQGMQILGEGAEGTDRLFRPIRRNSDEQLGSANVDAGAVGLEDDGLGLDFLFRTTRHNRKVSPAGTARTYAKRKW
jgi:hypothetical protein